ncbi:hypothetical protein N9H93_05180 [Rhizobiaceae bacterium]|nr:hypothetical protein [Rhizobiaceae bacterium]
MSIHSATTSAALLTVGLALTATPSSAQTIELGSDGQTLSVLERSGYEFGRITSRDFTIIRTEACKGADKFRVKVSILGKITSEQRIGECDMRPIAQQRREPPRPRDRGNRREDRRDSRLNNADLMQIARDRGLSDIEILNAEFPRYAIRGCRGTARFDLVVNRRGRIESETPAGTCKTPVAARDLPTILARKGLDRVRVLRDDRAPYLAEGCRRADLLEVRIDRFGDITNERRIGRCRTPITEAAAVEKMRASGITDITVSRVQNGFKLLGCNDDKRVEISLDAEGNGRSQTVVGTCRSQTVTQMLQTLESRGAINVVPLVEGCFDGERYRWTFDRRGNRTGRDRIGKC